MFNNFLTSTSDSASTGNNYTIYILLAVLLVAFIVMFVLNSRTNKKRAKEQEERLNSIKVGDKIKTIGGICGEIVEVDDVTNTFVLSTGIGDSASTIRFDKVAIYQTEPTVTGGGDAADESDKTEDKPEEKKQVKLDGEETDEK